MTQPRPQPPDEHLIDPGDRQFGASAARDQEEVDRLDEQGVDADHLPEEGGPAPRAGGKAEPED